MISEKMLKWWAENYPMAPENPLAGKTDEEVAAYIRKVRESEPEQPFMKNALSWCRTHNEVRPCMECLKKNPMWDFVVGK
jgi:hypothetical protein